MNNETFNMVSIDPGNNLGITIMTVGLPDYNIVDIKTSTLVLDKHIDTFEGDFYRMSKKLLLLKDVANYLNNNQAPLVYAYEQAFLNSRFPKAVMLLSQYTAMLESEFIIQNPFIKIFRYPPKFIKKAVGAGGNAKKDDMYRAVSKIPELNNLINLDAMTEHEVDSLSIAYTALTEIRKYPMIMCAF